MSKIRILYLITSLDTLGSARALVNIATGLDSERFEVLFCHCDNRTEGTFQNVLRNRSIPSYGLNTTGPLDIRAIYRLVKILRKERVDIVHSRLHRADFYARLAGRLANVPLIVNNSCDIYSTHFTSWHKPWIGRLFYVADRLTLRLADRFVANSEGVKRDLIRNVGIPEHRVSRIYNGIDVHHYARDSRCRLSVRKRLGLKPSECVVGTVTNLNPNKGLEYLIQSARQVAARSPHVRFLVVGDGPDRHMLEAQRDKLGLEGVVRFLGRRGDVPDLLSGLDIFAFPSLFEGHPNAVIEAMAAGLPVVASDIPGNNELVKHGVTGYLVPARDSGALSEAITDLAGDHRSMRTLGDAGRQTVTAHLEIDEMVRQYREFYETYLRSQTGPR